MLPGKCHRIRIEFWRRLDWRLDQRGLARHGEQRRFRSSRQKAQVQRSWNQELAVSLFYVFTCPYADSSQRREGHAQSQTSRHERVETIDAGGASTSDEARGDPWHFARGDSLQEEGGVADFAEADRGAMGSKGRFLEYVWSI